MEVMAEQEPLANRGFAKRRTEGSLQLLAFAGSAPAVNQPALIQGLLAAILPELKQQIAAAVKDNSTNLSPVVQQACLFDPSKIEHDLRTAVLPRPAYLQEIVQLVPFGELPARVQAKLPEAHTRHEFSVLYTAASWGFDFRDFIEALLAAAGELPPEQALSIYQAGLSTLLEVQTAVLRVLSQRLEVLQHTGATRQLLAQSLNPEQEYLVLTDQTAELLQEVAKARFKASLSQAKQQTTSSKSDEQLAERITNRFHRRSKSQTQRQNVRAPVSQQQQQQQQPQQQQQQGPTRAHSQDRAARGRSRKPAPSSRPATGGQQQSGP